MKPSDNNSYWYKTEVTTYTSNPSGGILNYPRLMSNRPAFAHTQYVLKPKTLVLADFTAPFWSDIRIVEVIHQIKQLLIEGFTVYLWQGTEARVVNPKDLNNLYNRNNWTQCTPAPDELIANLMSTEHAVPSGQLHLLNFYELQTLLEEQESTGTLTLKTSHFDIAPANKRLFLERFKSIRKSPPPIIRVLINTYPYPDQSALVDGVKESDEEDIELIHGSYENLALCTQDMTRLLSEQSHQDTLGSINFQKIRALVLSTTCNINEIVFKFIGRTPGLIQLVINSNETHESDSDEDGDERNPITISQAKTSTVHNTFDALNLDCLKELRFEGVHLKSEQLTAMLKNTHSLRRLSITDNKGSIDALVDVDFQCLEELHLTSVTLTSEQLTRIVKKAPFLRKLSISLKENFRVNVAFDEIELCVLEELSVHHVTLTSEQLTCLSQKAPQLRKLFISDSKGFNNTFTGLYFHCLEDLYLVSVYLTSEHLAAILKNTPGLRRLSIADSKGSMDALAYVDFHCLEVLELTRVNPTSEHLAAILKNAPGLRRLSIANNEQSMDALAYVDFHCLEVLELSWVNLTSAQLRMILNNSPRLRVLSIKGGSYDSGNLESISLPCLTHLTLNQINISRQEVDTLIRSSPCLLEEQIEIKYCPNIDEDLKKQYPNLNFEAPRLLHRNTARRTTRSGPDTQDSSKPITQDNSLVYARADTEDTTSEYADADTTFNEGSTLCTQQVFYSPSKGQDPIPNFYRKRIISQTRTNPHPCSLNEAFILTTARPGFLINAKARRVASHLLLSSIDTTPDSALYVGHERLKLTGDWQSLSSLSPMEEMLTYSIDTADEDRIELKYSKELSLYYIKGRQGRTISINFLLKVPTPQSPEIPEAIKAIINELSSYTQGVLELPDLRAPSGEDYFQALTQQKKGACRHRSIAFQVLMQKQHPNIPVRCIYNDIHAFIELFINNQWIAVDLGGYPAALDIKKLPNRQELPILQEAPQKENQITQFEQSLATWTVAQTVNTPLSSYLSALMRVSDDKNHLVTLKGTHDLNALKIHIQAYCLNHNRPFFYVGSPEDLICSAAYIDHDLEHNTGEQRPGPGGPLHRFLNQETSIEKPLTLIINYSTFTPAEVVRFNSIVDVMRFVDGTAIPDSTIIIGLVDITSPECYLGADLTSRFNDVHSVPVSSAQLTQALEPLIKMPNASATIDTSNQIQCALYNSNHWEQKILGYWCIQGERLVFIEGALQKALKAQKSLVLHQAPWHLQEFSAFWQQALALRYIRYQSIDIHLPKDFQLIRTQDYNWDLLKESLTLSDTLSADARLLSPGLLYQAFSHQAFLDESTLDVVPGWIKQAQGSSCPVYLIQALSEDQWAMFLDECRQHELRPQVYLAAGIALPQTLIPKKEALSDEHPWDKTLSEKVFELVSNDIDLSVQTLLQEHQSSSWQIINISECSESDLLYQITYTYSEEKRVFRKTKTALLNAIEAGQSFIFTGTPSAELINALAPLLLAQKQQELSGHLIFVTEQSCMTYLTSKQHKVSAAEKKTGLLTQFNDEEQSRLEETLWESEPSALLKTRMHFLRRNPDADSSTNAWEGMHKLPHQTSTAPFTKANASSQAHAFVTQRLHAVNQILESQPYVFLTGLTAVGKSTFVEQILSKEHSIYYGMSAYPMWATDRSDGRKKILFIDEANLLPYQFSCFEGLFNPKPCVLLEGRIEELDKDLHRVVFAGNPTNYGDARQLAPFFRRHGNALVFNPMPPAYIFEALLKPLFTHTTYEEQALDLCRAFLDVYEFICTHSKDRVLISPREIQMMAILLRSYATAHPEAQNLQGLAKHYAYQIAHSALPERLQALLKQQFKPEENELSPRQATQMLLEDIITLSQWRRHSMSENPDPILAFGGLGGVILEGEPGIGKSELIHQVLKKRPAKHKPNICSIPISMQEEDRKALLVKAFNEGQIVLIDEINSSSSLEHLLNSLLMGKTIEGQRPEHPGFFIIATQNPITMAGRRAPSTALARRMILQKLMPFTKPEMLEVLTQKGLDTNTAQLMIDAYQKSRLKAEQEHLSPVPTFRDLIKLAERTLKAEQRARQKPTEIASVPMQASNTQTDISMPQGLLHPVPTNLKLDELKELFIAEYRKQFPQAVGLGFFAENQTSPESMHLYDIISEGMRQNNEIRRTCISLSWLLEDGKINPQAPQLVHTYYQALVNTEEGPRTSR